jgi:hypothetical protein
VRLVALGADFRQPNQRAKASQGGSERRAVVGAHHAAAARQGDRFDDAGIRQWLMADGQWLMVKD